MPSVSWQFFLMLPLCLAPPCGLFADKFRNFVEHHQDFADDYLYTENTDLHSAPNNDHQTQPSLSTLKVKGAAATSKTANGICPEFSDHDGTIDGLKKHN